MLNAIVNELKCGIFFAFFIYINFGFYKPVLSLSAGFLYFHKYIILSPQISTNGLDVDDRIGTNPRLISVGL